MIFFKKSFKLGHIIDFTPRILPNSDFLISCGVFLRNKKESLVCKILKFCLDFFLGGGQCILFLIFTLSF